MGSVQAVPGLCLPVQGPRASRREQGLLSGLSLGFPPQTGRLALSAGALPASEKGCPAPAVPPAARAPRHDPVRTGLLGGTLPNRLFAPRNKTSPVC